MTDSELRELWRSVSGPHAELTGPLIRYAGLISGQYSALLIAQAAQVDTFDRLKAQALEISGLLERAGVGPCPLPEGVRRLVNRLDQLADAAEMLWVVVANVSGSDWSQQSEAWQTAAARWRDAYFAAHPGLAYPFKGSLSDGEDPSRPRDLCGVRARTDAGIAPDAPSTDTPDGRGQSDDRADAGVAANLHVHADAGGTPDGDSPRASASELEHQLAAQAAQPETMTKARDQAVTALQFAEGAILDAVGLDDGLDGRAGEAVLQMIGRALIANGQTPIQTPRSDDDTAWFIGYLTARLTDLQPAQAEELRHSPVLQAVLDAIKGTLDPSTEIADHPNVKFAQMHRLKWDAQLETVRQERDHVEEEVVYWQRTANEIEQEYLKEQKALLVARVASLEAGAAPTGQEPV